MHSAWWRLHSALTLWIRLPAVRWLVVSRGNPVGWWVRRRCITMIRWRLHLWWWRPSTLRRSRPTTRDNSTGLLKGRHLVLVHLLMVGHMTRWWRMGCPLSVGLMLLSCGSRGSCGLLLACRSRRHLGLLSGSLSGCHWCGGRLRWSTRRRMGRRDWLPSMGSKLSLLVVLGLPCSLMRGILLLLTLLHVEKVLLVRLQIVLVLLSSISSHCVGCVVT
mmetsp:Transcript_5335/g.7447  ORF Transcript_5335/g.7447 Transcript_5335/m.7447 type:complete len:218 (-) Transcript_5335:115-768(-)